MKVISVLPLFIACFVSTQAFSNEYQVRIPIEATFKDTSVWEKSTSSYGTWTNSGNPYNCSNWTPAASTIQMGESFEQTATDCSQKQTRTIQEREINKKTQEVRNVGISYSEEKTIGNTISKQTALGTNNQECDYFYGSTATMSSWIRNDFDTQVEIWWKGTKITTIKPSIPVSTYPINGFTYNRNTEMKKDIRSSSSYYYYHRICRVKI